jgi:redox-sensitive bicupin YhaK (pirin superfamily)
MKKILHKSDTRGFANHGWLKSHHTFSFGNYQNSERMNFGMLRVLNDDVVQPKMGFGTHPHKNMEIISIPISGALSHKDSMDNKRSIEVGEVQVMSAGTGLTHSEFNDSETNEVNFLQLWIIPEAQNVTPQYDQKLFDAIDRKNKLQILVSSFTSDAENSLKIHQDAQISRIDLDENRTFKYQLKSKNHGVYVMSISGVVEIDAIKLNSRDSLGIYETESFTINTLSNSELLLIEVPL